LKMVPTKIIALKKIIVNSYIFRSTSNNTKLKSIYL